MNGIIKKKLNLLVHLARIDGDFHKSEREMIIRLVGNSSAVDEATTNPFADLDQLHDKEEILYLAIKLAQADGRVTDEEMNFCKTLASKLGFRESAAEEFVRGTLPSLPDFVNQVQSWKVVPAGNN